MKLKSILLMVLLVLRTSSLYSQEFHYTFKLEGTFTQDGTQKEVQVHLRPLFDKLLDYNPENNTFQVTTLARVTETMLVQWLLGSGYTLVSFQSDYEMLENSNVQKQ